MLPKLHDLWLTVVIGAPLVLLPLVALAEGAIVSPSVPAPVAAGAAGQNDDLAARLARRIARELEADRVKEARIDADLAVKQFPKDALLHLRRAQAQFSVALQLDDQFGQVAEDLNLSRALDEGLRATRNPPPATMDDPAEREQSEHARQDFIHVGEKLWTPAVLATVIQFQERARQQLKESGSLLEERSRALQEAQAELQQARQLGDDTVEGALTGLWIQLVPLLWREEREQLSSPAGSKAGAPVATPRATALDPTVETQEALPLGTLEKALAPFSEVTSASVLHAAEKVAKQYPSDPKALADAADVISVVAALMESPDPLRDHIRALLDHRYLKHPERYNPEATQAARVRQRQIYLQLRDAKGPDVVRDPSAVALQLYERALTQDPDDSLPWLRVRLYLLRVAFEPERAQPLLEELGQKEPDNAVVPLERARLAFVLEDDPAKGMGFIREAARLREFSRSYLVAVPDPLRTALKFHHSVRELVKDGWPGYGWLFGTLSDMRMSRLELQQLAEKHQRPELPDDELAAENQIPLLQIKLTGTNELAGLQLQLAQLFCQAPDYPDQLQGINEKADALVFIATWAKLPPDQQALVHRLQVEHQRAFASYPTGRTFVSVTPNGLEWEGPLTLFHDAFRPEGPRLTMSPRGVILVPRAGD